jgi:hypothetical protein
VPLTTLGAVFCLGVAGSTIAFYYLILVHPLSILPDPRAFNSSKLTWKNYSFYFAVMMGIGVSVYQGASSVRLDTALVAVLRR